ncbi:MAG: VCBS repeat-containing protein [Saprospiraceae bacterium]
MNRINCLWILLPLISGVLGCHSNDSSTPVDPTTTSSSTIFTLLNPEETGVQFENTLEEGLNTNILMYEYFYNGGGVACADFNGDQLPDLYFTANMSSNALYLNRGNLTFEDVTAKAGVGGRPGPWKTGVAAVDINGDGRMDIYVSYSGALPDEKRVNELFINEGNDDQGTPQFSEQANAYGLASQAYSNQAYFLDYDRDGDLDALLLNHNPKNLPILNEVSTAEFLKKDDPQRGVRLFQQDDGHFTDVTTRVGISGSALTYGLGLGITDINRDGWPDFYVSNDYAVPDYLYINNRNGTFSNKIGDVIGHNSQFSMGNDIADINNDGWTDIMTLDMLPEDNHRQKLLMAPDNYAKFDLNVRSGFHYQYMRNMLQLNNGNGTFSEAGQIAGVSNTDWSWSALLADYNNDGWKDLFVTNGYLRDYTNLDFINYMDAYVKQKGRLVREDVIGIINHMPASNVANYLFSNQDGLRFSNVTSEWGMGQTSNSNGAVYADLDRDGDLDLVVNNINQPAFIYRNNSQNLPDHHYLQIELRGEGKNPQGIGSRVTIRYAGRIQVVEQMPTRGYLSTMSPVIHFGLGETTQIDTLIIQWNSGMTQILTQVAADQLLMLKETDATGHASPYEPPQPWFVETTPPVNYEHRQESINDFDRQPLLTASLSYQGPCMATGDVNGDGREDLLIGGGKGQSASIYLHQSNGSYKPLDQPSFRADGHFIDADACIADFNRDGAPDIYIASGGYHQFEVEDPELQDRLYLNDGTGHFIRSREALPDIRTSTGCVTVVDANGDQSPDLFVGGRVIPGRYPEAPRSYLLINDGKGHFTDATETMAQPLLEAGMITDALWDDLDGDGQFELIVIGEWMPLTIYQWTNDRLKEVTDKFLDQPGRGWWNTLTVADLNEDGKPDILAGNFGTNSQIHMSILEPAELYFADFDQNGSVDPILTTFVQHQRFPYVTRDELLRQLAYLRSRFTDYASFADVTIEQIFKPEQLSAAGHLVANEDRTSVFLSQPDGKWAPGELPVEAQYAPVYVITVLDFNEDGHADILMTGNNHHVKLRLGQMDANYGVLLQGNGRGQFKYITQDRSGFKIQGDVRQVIKLGDQLLFGLNGGPVLSYRLNPKHPAL